MAKASDNIFPKLTLVEGSAPSSPSASDFHLYFDSADHLLKWKNSAGAVTTLSTGSSVTAHSESEAAALVNATSTGDAGSRADHFPGTSLDAAWASEATALSQGPTVKYSSMGMRHTSNNAHHRLRPYTPSGAFRVEARVRYAYGGGGLGLFVRDSGTGDASGNGILAHLGSTGRFEVYSLDTGTLTQRGSTLTETAGFAGPFVYLAIERDGSNNWSVYFSHDRALWVAGVTGHAKTFTVAKVGFRIFGSAIAAVDFFDVVS